MELGAAGYAAAGAASAAGAGMGLFGYNRGNYMMDQKLHFSRFTAGHTYAMAQTAQYREDITMLTSLTTGRMDLYHGIAGMTATILTAIYCPGRLGLHTPAPPAWLMGLAMVNIAGCYIWLGLTMWMAMHASLRADSAAVHMLTRFVRLPVPSQGMLDRARKFLSAYEEQPLREVLRVPFFRHNGKGKGTGGNNEDMDPDALGRTRHGNDVPAWFLKEKAIDQGEAFESMMPLAAQGTAPEHFEVYREIQNEWWPYDVYSRLSIFLAFMHLSHCWCFMMLAHQLTETRAFFVGGAVVIPFFVLQQIILTLDIMPSQVTIPLHRLGPFAQLFAYPAVCIEYRRYYDADVAFIGYILVYLAYACQLIYTIQLLIICAPDYGAPPEMAEVPSSSWWPSAWRLPRAFKHATHLVAPPRNLEPGQTDLAGEMRAAAKGEATATTGQLTAESAEGKRRDVHRALGKHGESPAWFNVKAGLIALIVAWCFLIAGFTIEILNAGTTHPSLLNGPGVPNNLRDPRYRPAKLGYKEPTEVGTGGALYGPARGVEGAERRLSELGSNPESEILSALPRHDLAEKLRSLLPYLTELATSDSRMGGGVTQTAATSMIPAAAQAMLTGAASAQALVQWPALFEPRLLACGHAAAHSKGKIALALSHHGRGAIISTAASHVGAKELPAMTTLFSLVGTSGHGPLVAAAWDEAGLLLAAATGAVLECPGSGPSEGLWHCRLALAAKLPIGNSKPFRGAVALSRAPLRAAIAFPDESAVTLFSHSGEPSDLWLPAGEVRTRASATSVAFSSAAKELFLASVDGAIAKLNIDEGSMEGAAAPLRGLEKHHWQAACPLHNGGIARLALVQEAGSREASLFLS
ncbi:unnamed protein product [Polarella glacialis]|uniref:Uncharacterized protein n=1 Tax=Polarella glacialis TaxID=89957 RepID=A0A813EJG7_POLGL|nr:unnamed protein product [Polarella glacialis]